jgi:hypothetical protein
MEVIMTTLDSGKGLVSRRGLLVGGMAAGSATVFSAGDAGAQAKLSKAAVRFTSSPKDGKSCRTCKLFVAPSSCTFVEGTTEPTGSCWIWRDNRA